MPRNSYIQSSNIPLMNVNDLRSSVGNLNLSPTNILNNKGNLITGRYNTIYGSNNLVSGYYNSLLGSNTFIFGSNNNNIGNNCFIIGNNYYNTINDAIIIGNTNSTIYINGNTIINGSFSITAYRGPTGPQGPQGPQGFQGPIGITGSSGTQGFQGNQGPQGFQGSSGPQGNQGFQGPQGFQGSSGPQGFQGSSGPQGNQGVQGPQGTQGIMGATGSGSKMLYYSTTTVGNGASSYNTLFTYTIPAGTMVNNGDVIELTCFGTILSATSPEFQIILDADVVMDYITVTSTSWIIKLRIIRAAVSSGIISGVYNGDAAYPYTNTTTSSYDWDTSALPLYMQAIDSLGATANIFKLTGAYIQYFPN